MTSVNSKNNSKQRNNLVEVLQFRAQHTPNKIAYGILDGHLNLTEITYSDLFLRVMKLASILVKNKIGENYKCMLIFYRELDFVISYLACSSIGAVPIPLNMPKQKCQLYKWEKVAKDSEAQCILTEKGSLKFLKDGFKTENCKTLSSMPIYIEEKEGCGQVDSKINEIAFLQYTSGSTGVTKGVMVTNTSLINNMKQIENKLKFNEESVIVSWLPFYHDLGLIYGILQGIYSGSKVILMSPDDFMQYPMNWLKAMSAYRATHTAAPNFAYELISKEVDKRSIDIKDINLASLKVAICGGEPVNINTMNKFRNKTERLGLKDNVLLPAYGLAEGTLIVSCYKVNGNVGWLKLNRNDFNNGVITILDRGQLSNFKISSKELTSDEVYLVGNGDVIKEHELFIKKINNGRILEVNNIGEVCFSGPSVTKGYWKNPKETKRMFNCDDRNRVYIKTGDLGFIDVTGELYISGRIKDLIIIRGVNYYPQDIERTSFNANEQLEIEGAAAFSIEEEGEEKLVVIQEVIENAVTTPRTNKWARDIRENILRVHGIMVETIIFVPPLSIARTVSRKIQRKKSKDLFLNNNLEKVIGISRVDHSKEVGISSYNISNKELGGREFLEGYLREIIGKELGILETEVDGNISFIELGINSMMSLSIRSSLEKELGVQISSTLLFNYNTIKKMSEYLFLLLNNNIHSERRNNNSEKVITILSRNDSELDGFSEDKLFELLKMELGDEENEY
ncbi:non-ribosomal peptide synthetase [Clostridium estertheticum]|uniref:non-ribosomal peptide synthetase n=1 Tax=Clostridium estertheticum TaxID=238834 RepID=UPI001C0B3E5A|nr:AMP-binding protein [Clostridium estertheticum]MBU3186315.1 AMP-binding protein [Clostridium estertheticum]